MGQLGVPELLMVLAVLAIVTGGKKLPEVSEALGRSIREFRNAVAADRPAPDHRDDSSDNQDSDPSDT